MDPIQSSILGQPQPETKDCNCSRSHLFLLLVSSNSSIQPSRMDQNFKFNQLLTIQFSPLKTFILLLLTTISLADDDPNYLACDPKSCGDGQNISFPFYIRNQQNHFCGYPGFQLSCNEKGNPVMNLSSNLYIIKQIFYHNQSLRVSDAAAVSETNSNGMCTFPRLRNVSIPGDRFLLAPDQTAELILLYNCNSSLSEKLLQYKAVNCPRDDENGTVLALFDDNSDLGSASEECRDKVVAPVEKHVEKTEIVIGEMLNRGFLLQWIASNCSDCQASGGKCGFDEGSYQFQCYCPDRPHFNLCTPIPEGNRKVSIRMVATVASAVGIGILIILAACLKKKLSSNNLIIFWKRTTENYRNIEDFLRNYGPLAPKRYSYADIKKMTNSFKHKLGQGGYGGVYRGKLLDGCYVAVKVLNESKGNGEDFINEVASISRTSHVNIVSLLGFCFEGQRRALVYEFMPKGSLEKFIYDKDPLTANHKLNWQTLYQIAVGVARGLEYLHRGCSTRIFHFDIKPHNILLDEDFCPKISDFGLAKICPRKESIVSMADARGTVGYIAPEVFCRNFGHVSHKSDVYSYGMMVFEMTGRKNDAAGINNSSDAYFPHWVYKGLETDEELILQGIKNEEDKECAKKMIIVSLWCIQTVPSNRPTISKVVEMLEGSLDSLELPPKPFLSSGISQVDSSSIQSVLTL